VPDHLPDRPRPLVAHPVEGRIIKGLDEREEILVRIARDTQIALDLGIGDGHEVRPEDPNVVAGLEVAGHGDLFHDAIGRMGVGGHGLTVRGEPAQVGTDRPGQTVGHLLA